MENNGRILQWQIQCVSHVTLFWYSALAKYFAPSTPTWLPPKLSIVSVWGNQWTNSSKQVECLNHITLFCSSALAKGSTPWSPTRLPPRLSVVSVCGKQWPRSFITSRVREWCYCVLQQRLSKTLYTFSTDLIACEVECCECLWKTNDA